MPTAITRRISPRFAECEVTHIERVQIDLALARSQHLAYTQALETLGCQVIELPEEVNFPDSVFVEDAAIILPEAAIITRPGTLSRRGEVISIAEALRPHRELIFIREPAILDGGDVLVMGKTIYIGLSTRSDASAIEQVRSQVGRFGFKVEGVEVHGCLHLKSAVTRLSAGRLLINRDWVDDRPFEGYYVVEVHPSEPNAANILMIGGTGIYPSVFPQTAEVLERKGFPLLTLDLSEIAKAEGAVTCCSLIL